MFWSPSTPVLARSLKKFAPPSSGIDLKNASSLATQPTEPAPNVPQRLPGLKRDEQSRRTLPVAR
jgi:hypothetical protein